REGTLCGDYGSAYPGFVFQSFTGSTDAGPYSRCGHSERGSRPGDLLGVLCGRRGPDTELFLCPLLRLAYPIGAGLYRIGQQFENGPVPVSREINAPYCHSDHPYHSGFGGGLSLEAVWRGGACVAVSFHWQSNDGTSHWPLPVIPASREI